MKTSINVLFCIIIVLIFGLNSCAFKTNENSDYKWQVTFEDNFDSFENSKWIKHHDNGNRTIWSNKELQFYKDENVEVQNGILRLTAKKESYYGKDVENEKQFDFTSGMICNSKSFPQTYGKWEMKVRFPYRKGFWPAFFLVPTQRPTLPEIDVFEYYGIDQNKISCTLHWGLDYSYRKDGKPFYYVNTKDLEGDFTDEWMVWSLECFPTKIYWKLNGRTVFESDEGIPTAPMYMIANVAVKDWAEIGTVDQSNDPYIMEIDYVKIYKMVPK